MTLTNGERIILLMLADIQINKPSQYEIEPEFIKSAILDGQEWAIRWQYPAVPFSGPKNDPPELEEVLDILEMWDVIERTYEQNRNDRQASEGKGDSEQLNYNRFPGFDGNHETSYWQIAHYLTNKLGRFTRFKGRYLGGAVHRLRGYQRMLEVYRKTRLSLTDGTLTDDQLEAILSAMKEPVGPTKDSANEIV
ncbi:MAG: hypothetical protein RL594_18 [Bacteroidota bacterium]|jgi:uncharacterized protein YfbU (UPF0304 family)